jgi:hypothetical protein
MADLLPMKSFKVTPEVITLPPRAIQDQKGIDACLSCAITSAQEARSVKEPVLAGAYHYRLANPSLAAGGVAVKRALEIVRYAGLATYHGYFGGAFSGTQLVWQPAHLTQKVDPKAANEAQTRRLAEGLEWLGPGVYVVSGGIYSAEVLRWLRKGVPSLLIFKPTPAYRALNGGTLGKPETYRLSSVDGERESLPHAVCVLGYLQGSNDFVIQDSRGESFGAGGQWLLPSRFLAPGFILQVLVWNSPAKA